MQNPNPSQQLEKISRTEFLEEAGKLLANTRFHLARLHGGQPCMFGVETREVQSWSAAKREETLSVLRANLALAEKIIEEAQKDRLALWMRSEATYDDLSLPMIIQHKQIREDLEAYEDTLHFVRTFQMEP